jgi:hypothetical protein
MIEILFNIFWGLILTLGIFVVGVIIFSIIAGIIDSFID